MVSATGRRLGAMCSAFQKKRLAFRVDVGADNGQAAECNAIEIIRHQAKELRVCPHGSRVHARLRLASRSQSRRRSTKLLVRDEPRDEDLTGLVGIQIPKGVVLVLEVVAVRIARLGGNKRGGLDIKQGGGNENEVARHVEVEVAHALDLLEVLIGDLRDRDGADRDFLPGHELEQQVEKARRSSKSHLIRHLHHRLHQKVVKVSCGKVQEGADRIDAKETRENVECHDQDGHGVRLNPVILLTHPAMEQRHDDL